MHTGRRERLGNLGLPGSFKRACSLGDQRATGRVQDLAQPVSVSPCVPRHAPERGGALAWVSGGERVELQTVQRADRDLQQQGQALGQALQRRTRPSSSNGTKTNGSRPSGGSFERPGS